MPIAVSRRNLFKAGGGVLLGASLVSQAQAAPPNNEAVLRTWFKLWAESRDWAPFDAILTDDFTFTSPNDQDHISKAAFKQQCWDTQINLTKSLDIELMIANRGDVFVKYLGHTVSGKTFRNVELHKVRNGKIASIECYFGGKMTFPSAVESGKN
jgi:hypothetical protein